MADMALNCPNCGFAIPLTEALSGQLRAQLETALISEHQQQLRGAAEHARRSAENSAGGQITSLQTELEMQLKLACEAEAREVELKRHTLELQEAQRTLAERTRIEMVEQLRGENESRLQTLVQEATARARRDTELELKFANEQLAEERRKVAEAQRHELTLRQQTAALAERTRSLDLEIARGLDKKRTEWEAGLRESIGEEQSLRLREKELQIDGLRKVIDDLQRKSQQGSQELQGEVLELDVQAALERLFPLDTIVPVPKGAAGADLIQTVRNSAGQVCGSIAWETKNTKHWQAAWLGKLRDDQRATGSNLAVLVSVTLPADIQGFGQIDGVWVASLPVLSALATALREQLIQVAFAHAASHGKGEKMELIYRYLAGDQFRQKVDGIVEAFTAMQMQLNKERRAMGKQWKQREKQIERVITSTVGMYGEMSGILGGALQRIPALELDDSYLLEKQTDDA